MDRLLQHLEHVGDVQIFIAIAAIAFLGFLIMFLRLPPMERLAMSLFGLTVCQGIGQFQDFGAVATFGKFLAFPALALIIVSCLMIREPGQTGNPLSFVLIGAAVWGILCVFVSLDKQLAIPIRLLWLMLVVAAVGVASVADTPAKAVKILSYIFWGMAVITVIALTSIVVGSGGWTGRLYPYAANPNQISTVFAFTFIYGFYRSVTGKNLLESTFFAVVAGLGGIAIILTVSRAAILLAFIPSLPILMRTSRKPARLIGLVLLLVAMALVMLPKFESHSFGHLFETEGHGRRTAYWMEGVQQFLESPYVGLLGISNDNAIAKDVNPHNAYVSILCLGGLVLAIPYAIAYGAGLVAAVTVGLKARLRRDDKMLLNVLVLLYVCQLLHGFVNEILFYATFTWAFVATYLCFFFMNFFLRNLRNANHGYENLPPLRKYPSPIP